MITGRYGRPCQASDTSESSSTSTLTQPRHSATLHGGGVAQSCIAHVGLGATRPSLRQRVVDTIVVSIKAKKYKNFQCQLAFRNNPHHDFCLVIFCFASSLASSRLPALCLMGNVTNLRWFPNPTATIGTSWRHSHHNTKTLTLNTHMHTHTQTHQHTHLSGQHTTEDTEELNNGIDKNPVTNIDTKKQRCT